MDAHTLDAFVYPTWSNPPRLIGDLNTPHGDNSQFFSPTTGFPSIQVPMGHTRGGLLPAGVTFFGRAWSAFKGGLVRAPRVPCTVDFGEGARGRGGTPP